jgi:hypothetical protein
MGELVDKTVAQLERDAEYLACPVRDALARTLKAWRNHVDEYGGGPANDADMIQELLTSMEVACHEARQVSGIRAKTLQELLDESRAAREARAR